MFRPIRRKKKEMDIDAAKELLQCSRRGVLAVNGDDGYPYAVPVNYFYDSDAGKIYFHGARVGHKVDALKASDKVCFTVYGNETVKEEAYHYGAKGGLVMITGGYPFSEVKHTNFMKIEEI